MPPPRRPTSRSREDDPNDDDGGTIQSAEVLLLLDLHLHHLAVPHHSGSIGVRSSWAVAEVRVARGSNPDANGVERHRSSLQHRGADDAQNPTTRGGFLSLPQQVVQFL